MCSMPKGKCSESLFESCLLSCVICKTEVDWNVLSVSLPTCRQWCGAKISITENRITHYFYFTVCIISKTLHHSILVCLDRSRFPLSLSLFPFLLFYIYYSCPWLPTERTVQLLVERSQSNALSSSCWDKNKRGHGEAREGERQQE